MRCEYPIQVARACSCARVCELTPVEKNCTPAYFARTHRRRAQCHRGIYTKTDGRIFYSLQMGSRELKRLSNTHGFEVAKRSDTKTTVDTGAITTRTMAVRAEVVNTTTHALKKKKKKNPYSGASGPFARKHKWAVRKKRKHPPTLDLEAAVPAPAPDPDPPIGAASTIPSSQPSSPVASPASSLVAAPTPPSNASPVF